MEIQNDTAFADGLAIGLGPERRPTLAVIVKATFTLPERGQPPTPAEEQLPIVTADEYYKGDITGSVRLEADNVPFKPRADVVLVGAAYAPEGRPVQRLDAALRVGRLRKTIRVFGDRQWLFGSRMLMVPEVSAPQPFARMPLVYERAFGGADRNAGKWCAENTIGKGFIGKKSKASVDGTPLPNLEDPNRPIISWKDRPAPAGFGFCRKDWRPRAGYAGTIQGQQDADETFGLPSDFRHDFFNAASPDMQVPGYLSGDEEVELRHLTPDGWRRFRLPGIRPVITLRTAEEKEQALDAPLDTLVFLPDEGVFYQVWRGRYPVRDLSLEEVAGIDIRSDEPPQGRRR